MSYYAYASCHSSQGSAEYAAVQREYEIAEGWSDVVVSVDWQEVDQYNDRPAVAAELASGPYKGEALLMEYDSTRKYARCTIPDKALTTACRGIIDPANRPDRGLLTVKVTAKGGRVYYGSVTVLKTWYNSRIIKRLDGTEDKRTIRRVCVRCPDGTYRRAVRILQKRGTQMVPWSQNELPGLIVWGSTTKETATPAGKLDFSPSLKS